MRARLFSHDLNFSAALFQMAFQVKILASRGDNSTEVFMQGTSTAFSYQYADAYHVDASSMESYDAGLIDDKLSEIFATACLKKRTLKQEKTATGTKFILVPGKESYVNELIIRDIDKMYFDPKQEVKNYISEDPRLTRKIFDLLQTEYEGIFPETFPKLDVSVENKKWQLRVTGTKDQIILFTDALIAISTQEMKPAVHAENKLG